MSRIAIPSLDDSPEGSKPTLNAVHKQLGVVPNLYRLIGNSPAALNAFASFQGGLSKSLGVKTHERIALAVAQVNGCGYCLSAHTYLGLNLAKISPEEIALNRKGASGDAKANAAVAFAAKVARERGHVSDADIAAVRVAGFTDAELVESPRTASPTSWAKWRRPRSTSRSSTSPRQPEPEQAGADQSRPLRLSGDAPMSYGFLDIAVTPSVRAAQASMGADRIWQDFKDHREFDRFTDNEATFIANRDSFYMASVSETGWPYVQHRGGPPGFLKLIDDRTLAFADYRGNRQYISLGNLAADDRACLFLMDYTRRTRLKVYVRVETIALDTDPKLTRAVTDADYGAKLERIFRLRLETFDWNCAQHITRRFSEAEVARAVGPLRDRLSELENENATLRSRLTDQGH